MTALLRHPTGRLLALTAAAGSAADWILFATLVVTVDTLLAGSVWATAIVLATRILPGVVFAPIAARRIDRADLTASLRRFELLRVGSVVGLAGAASIASLPLAAASLASLEFAAAMQAAGRESVTSRHVPPTLFVRLNTATAVLSYGLLPVGAAVVGLLGVQAGWLLAIGAYAAVASRYRTLELPVAASASPGGVLSGTPGNSDHGWLRVTVAAALGLVPAVALFSLAPDLSGMWLDDRAATAPLYALVLAGGAVGFWVANTRAPHAVLGLVVAAAGGVVAATGTWMVGLPLLGLGAGTAYLDVQHRLQRQAQDPSQFAAAFAILKVAAGLAAVAAPAFAASVGLSVTLALASTVALVGGVLVAPMRGRAVQVVVREVLGLLLRVAVRVQVVNPEARLGGPVVVVSNHPHWLDGAVVVQGDRSLRPVARWQPRVDARLAIWAGNAVVTTAGTGRDHRPAYLQAADHLRAGGRIWLAPEGGSHQDVVLRTPRSGAVRMAHAADVPIQPLGIRWESADGAGPGPWRPWRRPRVSLTWGRPLLTTGSVDGDNNRMMASLADASDLLWPQPGRHVSASAARPRDDGSPRQRASVAPLPPDREGATP